MSIHKKINFVLDLPRHHAKIHPINGKPGYQERVMIDYVNAPKPTQAPWWMANSQEIKFWSLIATMIIVGGLA